MAATRIYYLIITNSSEMLVKPGSSPFTIPHIDYPVKFIDVKKIDKERRKIKKLFRDYVEDVIESKVELGKNISICFSDDTKNTVVLVHPINDSDKGNYANNGYSFVKTFDIPDTTTGLKVPTSLDPESVKLFTDGDYQTRNSPLDKCIKSAIKKFMKSEDEGKGIKLGDDKKEETIKIYRFYRPGLFVPPFIVDPVASLFAMQRYGIRSPYASPYNSPLSSPYSSPYSSPLSSRLRPEMPRRRYSPGDAPRGPRMSRLEGGFYEKYMKYKTKYLELKAQVI